MGVNRSGDRWTGWANLIKMERDHIMLRLWCVLRTAR
jgi:hypothetical protein